MLLGQGKMGMVSAKRFRVIGHPGIWVGEGFDIFFDVKCSTIQHFFKRPRGALLGHPGPGPHGTLWPTLAHDIYFLCKMLNDTTLF